MSDRVSISTQGREGSVTYRDTGGTLHFYWEISGGDAVASVRVGTQAEWIEQYPAFVGRRNAIIEEVATALIAQQAPGCRAVVEEAWIHLVPDPSRPPPTAQRRPAGPSPAEQHFAMSERKARLALWIGAAVLAAGLMLWLLRPDLRTSGIRADVTDSETHWILS